MRYRCVYYCYYCVCRYQKDHPDAKQHHDMEDEAVSERRVGGGQTSDLSDPTDWTLHYLIGVNMD